MAKVSLEELDAGQLGLMWSMLQLKKECTLTKGNISSFKHTLDKIRLAMIQKTAGQRSGDNENNSVSFKDLGTYINIAICQALELYIYGGLDELEKILPDDLKERDSNA